MDCYARRFEPLQWKRYTDLQTEQKTIPTAFSVTPCSAWQATRTEKSTCSVPKGVAQFDLTTQRFTTLLQGNINSIYYKNGLFIGKKNEIYRYNEQTDNFDLYYQMAGENIEISCMFEDKGHMWIGTTSEGVFNLKIDEHLLTHPIEKGNITSIYQDNAGELWIGSWEKGLFRDENRRKYREPAKRPKEPA